MRPTRFAFGSCGLLLVPLLLALPPAQAQVSPAGWYLGGSGGRVRADAMNRDAINQALQAQGLGVRTVSVDDSAGGWKVFAGYRFHRNLAVEGGYTSLGSYGFQGQVISDPGTVEATFRAEDTNIFAVGIVPLGGGLDLFGKAGLGYWRAKLSVSGTFSGRNAQQADASGTAPVVGLGASFDFTPEWGARVEWERFYRIGKTTGPGQTDMDFWSLGLQYRF